MEIWRQENKVTRKKVDRGQRIEDRGKKEMLNHKFQITNHSPFPDGLGPALLKKGGGHKQILISKFKCSKQEV